MRQRRRVRGYTDLGSVRVPPFPANLVFTDREDGSLWHLSHKDDSGTPRVTLNDSLPTQDVITFEPYDGPVVATSGGRFRLFVRDGRLGYEDLGEDRGYADKDQMRLLTRKAFERTLYEIIEPSTFDNLTALELGYEDVTF